jgi:hypothetical protein
MGIPIKKSFNHSVTAPKKMQARLVNFDIFRGLLHDQGSLHSGTPGRPGLA